MNDLLKVLDLIIEINSEVGGKGIDFLTLRDDYHSVTGNTNNYDSDRKYSLHETMNLERRSKQIGTIEEFKNKKDNLCRDLHVDFGYSLEFLAKGYLDKGLIKVSGNQIAKYGYPQLSIAIDLHGDIFLFREAGFLNRSGNKKVIIGRISKNFSLKKIIQNFLSKNNPIEFNNDDTRFLDSFDHVLSALVNQYNNDKKFGIPFEDGPISSKEILKGSIGNNWVSDEI